MIVFVSIATESPERAQLKPSRERSAKPARFKTSGAHICPLNTRLSRCRAEWDSYQWLCPVTNDERAVYREAFAHGGRSDLKILHPKMKLLS